jgi:hypothetical protein
LTGSKIPVTIDVESLANRHGIPLPQADKIAALTILENRGENDPVRLREIAKEKTAQVLSGPQTPAIEEPTAIAPAVQLPTEAPAPPVQLPAEATTATPTEQPPGLTAPAAVSTPEIATPAAAPEPQYPVISGTSPRHN